MAPPCLHCASTMPSASLYRTSTVPPLCLDFASIAPVPHLCHASTGVSRVLLPCLHRASIGCLLCLHRASTAVWWSGQLSPPKLGGQGVGEWGQLRDTTSIGGGTKGTRTILSTVACHKNVHDASMSANCC